MPFTSSRPAATRASWTRLVEICDRERVDAVLPQSSYELLSTRREQGTLRRGHGARREHRSGAAVERQGRDLRAARRDRRPRARPGAASPARPRSPSGGARARLPGRGRRRFKPLFSSGSRGFRIALGGRGSPPPAAREPSRRRGGAATRRARRAARRRQTEAARDGARARRRAHDRRDRRVAAGSCSATRRRARRCGPVSPCTSRRSGRPGADGRRRQDRRGSSRSTTSSTSSSSASHVIEINPRISTIVYQEDLNLPTSASSTRSARSAMTSSPPYATRPRSRPNGAALRSTRSSGTAESRPLPRELRRHRLDEPCRRYAGKGVDARLVVFTTAGCPPEADEDTRPAAGACRRRAARAVSCARTTCCRSTDVFHFYFGLTLVPKSHPVPDPAGGRARSPSSTTSARTSAARRPTSSRTARRADAQIVGSYDADPLGTRGRGRSRPASTSRDRRRRRRRDASGRSSSHAPLRAGAKGTEHVIAACAGARRRARRSSRTSATTRREHATRARTSSSTS